MSLNLNRLTANDKSEEFVSLSREQEKQMDKSQNDIEIMEKFLSNRGLEN